MSYTVNLPTTGTAHPAATVDAAKAYARSRGAKRLDDVDQFITTVWDRSKAMGIRPEIAFGQWCDETGVGTSSYWVNNLNPGGLRITYDGEHSNTWADGNTAALGMLHRLSLYIYGYEHQAIPDGKQYDPAPEAVGQAGYLGIAKKLDDLSGHWAANPNYGTQIAGHLNQAFPNGDDSYVGAASMPETPLTFGKVPHPDYHDRPISKPEGNGQNNLGKRSVLGVTYHRMLGSLNGTDSFFRMPSTGALTDYGMGVADTDGDDLDAVVYRWNDPLGYQSGWASGRVIAPWGDGAQFVAKYGANAVNKLRASIEISGNYDTPISNAVKQRIAEISAYWADQAEIPWNVYPIRPEDDFSFVCWHQEFTGPQEKICPGPVVMNATNDIIARTAAILKQYQTQAVVIPPTPKPDKYAAPVTYPWLAQDDGKVHSIGSTRVLPLTLTYTATRSTPRYQKGSKQSDKIGPNIAKGTQFEANRVFRSAEGVTFVMTRYGSRVLASALLPRVGVTASGRISVRNDADAAPEVISDNVEATA